MPEFGRVAGSAVATVSAEGDAPGAPWSVAGATLQLLTFEVDADATLDYLPEMLSRPAPPYARLLIADYADSPVGPYSEATLLLSCRYLMLPRQLVVASIVTSEAAAAANARNWGYESELGEVSLTKDGAEFVGRVTTRSAVDITAISPNALETGAATIRYDPTIVVQPGSSGVAVMLISAEPETVHEAWLASGSTCRSSVSDRQSPWWRLRSRNPITGTVARADIVRPESTVVEPPAPGSGGGLP